MIVGTLVPQSMHPSLAHMVSFTQQMLLMTVLYESQVPDASLHAASPLRSLYPTASTSELMDATTAFERLKCCVIIAERLDTDADVLYANPAAQQALSNSVSRLTDPVLQGQPQQTSSASLAVFEGTGDSSQHRTPLPSLNGPTAVPETEGPLSAVLTGHPLSHILPHHSILDVRQVCLV